MVLTDDMVTVEVHFTEDDLSADTMDAFDCPGYRAVKRVVPTLTSWCFRCGEATDPETGTRTIVSISKEAEHKLICHSYYQTEDESGDPEFPAQKADPFSCLITVPKRLVKVEQ